MSTNPKWSIDALRSHEDRERWRKLVDAQSGVVSTTQLADLGVSRNALRAQLAAQRWRRVLPAVYAVFTGPLPRSSLISAALLYGGPWAVLSHRTAAEEWGMLPAEADAPVHITVPYGNSAVSQTPFVHVHRSRAFKHIVAPSDPPRTNREDTVIDVAASEPSAEAARNTFIQLVGSNRIPIALVHDQLERRPPFRRAKVLKNALEMMLGGAVSALEAEYLVQVERAHRLPAGLRQVPFDVDGIVLWEDVAYDSAGAQVTVRLDGREFHATDRVAFRDRRRDNAAELAGRARLVYGWHEVHNTPCAVAAEVAEVLVREGWRGSAGPCPHCR
ncbi:Transcriptional regulator, AbiEi antitoxin, Type IV TA system [Saccharopolyspora kobensis]|uniref:Transcriptional regulator, AbiEi antitoxin, Type IV TA system n=1 Tax=Saccharopolyspora kobensis TaxID=146035 RepID=A0A1H6EI25_9PSEU|nr:Transcriptional regulator, AbiEi antitoxin, Type IV TA system [Saccharopolyspora kobensis]SFE65049.1 Transcriptional regulator, AbiEi antitoxin, Type IV TA system [Saccharopolyspora kobensis]